jgi:uncharacterized membrane protein YuzA (DUF378 family)
MCGQIIGQTTTCGGIVYLLVGGLAVTKLDGVCVECKTPYQWNSNYADRHKKRWKGKKK